MTRSEGMRRSCDAHTRIARCVGTQPHTARMNAHTHADVQHIYVGLITPGSGFGTAAASERTMPPPSVLRLLLVVSTVPKHLCELTYSVLYVFLYSTFLVLNPHWTSRGIAQPEAFCAGTTAAYRNGNGRGHSALTLRPPCTRRCAQPAPGLPRRLRHVPRLRHLRRHQLGQGAGGC